MHTLYPRACKWGSSCAHARYRVGDAEKQRTETTIAAKSVHRSPNTIQQKSRAGRDTRACTSAGCHMEDGQIETKKTIKSRRTNKRQHTKPEQCACYLRELYRTLPSKAPMKALSTGAKDACTAATLALREQSPPTAPRVYRYILPRYSFRGL